MRAKSKRAELKRFLGNFFALEIVPGKKVRIPYWRNKLLGSGQRIEGSFGGKGTPEQIKKAALQKAEQAGINLETMSSVQIRQFMRQKRIGVDCSGFVFHVLNFLQPGFWQGSKMAPGTSKNPARRLNAAALTSQENTSAVSKVADIRVGDLIPISFGGRKVDHVLIVVDINDKKITYAHSSFKTPNDGPHLGKIKIVDKNLGLKEQEWLEKTKEGVLLSGFLTRAGVRRMRERNRRGE